jgi:hypothetical protein
MASSSLVNTTEGTVCTNMVDMDTNNEKGINSSRRAPRTRTRIQARNMQGMFSLAWCWSTMAVMFLLLVVLLPVCITAEGEEEHEEEEEIEPVQAVLFPWFAQALGIITFYILSRYAPWLPYTGVLFLLGTIAGIGTSHLMNH